MRTSRAVAPLAASERVVTKNEPSGSRRSRSSPYTPIDVPSTSAENTPLASPKPAPNWSRGSNSAAPPVISRRPCANETPGSEVAPASMSRPVTKAG